MATQYVPSMENPIRKFRKIRFWAIDGMVCLVNDENGEERCIPPMIAIKQSNQFLKQAQNMRRGGFGNYQDERRETLQLAVDLRECARYAQKQGAPLQEEVAKLERELKEEYHRELRRKAARAGNKPLVFLPTTPSGLIVPTL